MNERKHEFWNSRATLGARAGTYDTNLKQIEVRTLCEHIRPNSSVLDIGCGNGETLIELSKRNNCIGTGVDFADDMIEEARKSAVASELPTEIEFEVGEVPKLNPALHVVDYAITERCLINLDTYEEQHEAIVNILDHVRSGGTYLMLEHSQQGLDGVNELRQEFDLEPIVMPWHNLYMDDARVNQWADELWDKRVADIISVSYPASSYYLLSRVVYAKMIQGTEETPDYNSIINQIAIRLPSFGEFGYLKLWVWRKF